MVKKPLVIPGIIVASALVFAGMIHIVAADDVQTSVNLLVCGDGIFDGIAEVCDDGTNLGGYGSTTAERKCMPGCQAFAEYCGDGVLQVRFSEQCDDGNTISTDLCSLTCTTLAPAGSTVSGSPTVGSTPFISGAQPGNIASETQTRVVLRGKAYPNTTVNILLDGKVKGTTLADSNADFQFTSTDVTPGTATFGFTARDANGVESITTSIVFDVAQSAVSTVANVFFPPTISVSQRQVPKGDALTVSGYTVPKASITSEIGGGTKTSLTGEAEQTGAWAIRVDTASLTDGLHTVKAFFKQEGGIQSGFGKSISFSVGEAAFADTGSADLNGDTKVNLVDFSIFLLRWNTDDIQSDFNGDGTVNLGDFSIMLFNWTG